MEINTNTAKRQLIIFFMVAYALPFVLGGLMGYVYTKGGDVSVFPAAQMFYPAAGVILAALITRKGDRMIPRRFFIGFLILTAAMILCVAGSVFFPRSAPVGQLSFWNLSSQYLMMIGSVILLIVLLTEKKEKRAAYGLRGGHWKAAALIAILFLALYIVRAVVMAAIGGEAKSYLEVAGEPLTWIMFASLFINYFLLYTAFFGEEYGWRYYLQPVLQKKLGMTLGIFAIGLIWGLWHLPINFFYYTSPSMGLISLTGQFITCTALGIFFGWAYLKTNNIWSVVILHFANNNLIPIISGNYSSAVIQNQQISWTDVGLLLVVNGILFAVFLFSPYFRDSARRLPTMDERADDANKSMNEPLYDRQEL